MTISVPSQLSGHPKKHFFLELYLTAGTQYFNSSDINIVWSGNNYISFPFGIKEARRTPTGVLDRIELSASNVSRDISTLLLGEVFRGKRMVLRLFAMSTDYAIASPVVTIFDGLMDNIEFVEGTDSASVVLNGATDLAFWQRPIPGRTYQATCAWVSKPSPSGFKGVECKYAGAESTCDGTWDRCVALTNSNNYGGFRHLPKVEILELWWGRAGVFRT